MSHLGHTEKLVEVVCEEIRRQRAEIDALREAQRQPGWVRFEKLGMAVNLKKFALFSSLLGLAAFISAYVFN